jgi:hypothetical protein
MKDIALFFRCDRKTKIRFFVDATGFNGILVHLKKYKTHVIELEEIQRLIYDDLQITEKYCDLKIYTKTEGYKIMILSRGRSKATILCKETNEGGYRNIILIKLYTGTPEDTVNLIKDEIKNKGGYDYEFKE